jgi:hypothetical protein
MVEDTNIQRFKTQDDEDDNPIYVSVVNEFYPSENSPGLSDDNNSGDEFENNVNIKVEYYDEGMDAEKPIFVRPDSPLEPPPGFEHICLNDSMIQSEPCESPVPLQPVELLKRSYLDIASSIANNTSSLTDSSYEPGPVHQSTVVMTNNTNSALHIESPSSPSSSSNNCLRILKKENSIDNFSFSSYNIADDDYWHEE